MYGQALVRAGSQDSGAGSQENGNGLAAEAAPTTAVGFVFLPRFQAEVEARLLGLEGRPIVVHQRGRLVSLSEAAEKLGLKGGMRLAQAQAICPHAEFIPLVEDRYQPFWKAVLDLCVAHTGNVEPREPGEVFVNLADLKQPEEALACLQQAVEARTGLTCWIGCGPSKLVARIVGKLGTGTNFRRELVPVPDFLDPLPITELWTLDPKTIEHLQALGITTIGLLRRIPPARLAEHFGRAARRLQDLAQGLDRSPVEPRYPPREVTVHQTLPGGVDNPEAIDACLRKLAVKIARELRRRQETGGRLSLRVTTEEGPQFSSSIRLREPSAEEDDLLRAARSLLTRLNLPAPISALRLQASECRRDRGRQLSLFYDHRALARKREKTRQALAVIRECFGNDIAVLGAEMERPRRERFLAMVAPG